MVSRITLRHGASSPSPSRRHLEMGVDPMTNVSQREVGSRNGVVVLQAKNLPSWFRPLLKEDGAGWIERPCDGPRAQSPWCADASGWSLDRKLIAAAFKDLGLPE